MNTSISHQDSSHNQDKINLLSRELLSKKKVVPPIVNALALARIAKYMPEDSIKNIADAAFDRLEDTVETIAKSLNDMKPNSVDDDNDITFIANLTAQEISSISEQSVSLPFASAQDSLRVILDKCTSPNASSLIISTIDSHALFTRDILNKIPSVIEMAKGNQVTLTDWALNEIFLHSDKRLSRDLQRSDSSQVAKELPNLLAITTFNELSKRVQNKSSLNANLFLQTGSLFAKGLYSHAIQNSNADYAMLLLGSHDYGAITVQDSSFLDANEVKNMLKVVSSDIESRNKLVTLAHSIDNNDEQFELLKKVVEIHNDLYKPINIEAMTEVIASKLTENQFKELSKTLIRNHQNQPVLPALDKLIDAAKKNGFDVSYIRSASNEIKEQLIHELSNINEPMVKYSSVHIQFDDGDESIALRDARSVPHFKSILDDYIKNNHYNSVEITGSNSMVDKEILDALNEYLQNSDSTKLNDLMTRPIRELDSKHELGQLLFESNKQNKIMPAPTDNVEVMADTLDSQVIYIGDKRLMRLSDLRSSNDFLRRLPDEYNGSVDIDDTNLGKVFNKQLKDSLNALVKNRDSLEKRNQLDDIVGLPVNSVSSKIENQQDFTKQTGEILKNVGKTMKNAAVNVQEQVNKMRQP